MAVSIQMSASEANIYRDFSEEETIPKNNVWWLVYKRNFHSVAMIFAEMSRVINNKADVYDSEAYIIKVYSCNLTATLRPCLTQYPDVIHATPKDSQRIFLDGLVSLICNPRLKDISIKSDNAPELLYKISLEYGARLERFSPFSDRFEKSMTPFHRLAGSCNAQLIFVSYQMQAKHITRQDRILEALPQIPIDLVKSCIIPSVDFPRMLISDLVNLPTAAVDILDDGLMIPKNSTPLAIACRKAKVVSSSEKSKAKDVIRALLQGGANPRPVLGDRDILPSASGITWFSAPAKRINSIRKLLLRYVS